MSLRVLSLNVWGLPPPVGHLVDERLDRIARELRGLELDVALFQEVWTEPGRQRLRDAGPAAGLPHCWWPEGPARERGGLLVLSRHPIQEPSYRPYRLCGLPYRFTQMDYYSGKGVAHFELDSENGRVAFLDTHLHARYAPLDVTDDYIGHRSAELIEVADVLRQIPHPAILAGDLNMQESSPEYRLLRDLSGLEDAAVVLDARQPTSQGGNPFRRSRGSMNESRIDYVMSRSGERGGARPVAVSRVFDSPLELNGEDGAYSDHAGVLAEIELSGPGEVRARVPDSAFDLGRQLLETGRAGAGERRSRERSGAALGLALAAGCGAAVWRPALDRRRFLKLGLGAAAVAAGGTGAGLLLSSERFIPDELADYTWTEALLDQIERDEHRRRAPSGRVLSLR